MEVALLDTDTVSEILKQRSQNVLRRAAEYLKEHEQFTFSEFTWFEIRRGLEERNAHKQLEYFTTFADHGDIKPIDRAVLHRAAKLWAVARNVGASHSDADLIIAATALVNGTTLVTGNTKHFGWIEELKLRDWRDS
jgi:tRNA(fMet)-specific endonuclease VapC